VKFEVTCYKRQRHFRSCRTKTFLRAEHDFKFCIEWSSARDHAGSAGAFRIVVCGSRRVGLFRLRARDSSLKMYGTNESHGPNHGPWTPPPAPQPLPPQAQHQNHPRPHPHNHPPSHPPYVPPAYQHPHHHLPPQVIIDGYIPHIRLGRGSKIRAKSETT